MNLLVAAKNEKLNIMNIWNYNQIFIMSNALKQTLKNCYKYGLTLGGTYGSYKGAQNGHNDAKNICFTKDNPSNIEYFSDLCCFGVVVASHTITGFMLGTFYAAVSPLSVPLTYYVCCNNILDDKTDEFQDDTNNIVYEPNKTIRT